MPYAPQYQSGQVPSPRGGGQDFRAARDGANAGEAFAESGSNLARSVSQYAEVEDAIQATYDETQARRAALEYRKELQPLLAEFSALKGDNAVNGTSAARKRIEELREASLGTASNPRMKRLLDERVGALSVEADGKIIGHSQTELSTMMIENSKAERAAAIEDTVANRYDLEAAREGRAMVRASVSEQADLEGWEKERFDLEVLTALSGVNRASIDAFLAEPTPDLTAVVGFFEEAEERGELTAEDRTYIAGRLQGPLEQRSYRAAFFEVTSELFEGGAESEDAADGAGEGAAEKAAPRVMPVAGRGISDGVAAHKARGSAGVDFKADVGSSIVAPAAGVVEKVRRGRGNQTGVKGDGGNYVSIRTADGYLVESMHMQSPVAGLEVGDPVQAGMVIGTVGLSGNTTGPHLHLQVKDREDNQVDPLKWLNGSSPVGLPTDARNWDMASVMSTIDRKVDSGEWTVEFGEGVMGYARKRMADDQSLLADKENDALRAANEWMLEQGDQFTDFGQMPKEIADDLNPTDAMRLAQVAKSNLETPSGEAKPNGPVSIWLQNLRVTNPDLFNKIPLGEYVSVLSKGELFKFAGLQAKGQATDGGWEPSMSQIKTTFATMSEMDGEKYNPEETAIIRSAMEDFLYVRREETGGKDITTKDLQDAYRHATGLASVEVQKSFMGINTGQPFIEQRPRYTVDGRAEKLENRDAIRRKYRSAHGKWPTDDELEFYVKNPSLLDAVIRARTARPAAR